MSTDSDRETDGNLARVLELSQPAAGGEPAETIHRVIDQCLISMVFQPIVDLETGEIFAYEALCRSRVPQFDSPPALIEAATTVGRVGELGRLQRALASRNCPDWPIFVNISPNEFDEGFLVRPDDAIFGHRQPVYVEITESVPLVFFEQCHSVLAELRRKGARLAIDDLGAGYSNLKYIADLAPDIVKLDRGLVAGCTGEGSQYDLLCSISRLCHQVNARVVAEGVENADELEAVTSAGIDYVQGYFLGRPKISPSELSWPASEIVASTELKLRSAKRAVQRHDDSPEGTERRLAELEEVRALLEKSVRKARGEVVRLRKAVSKAESEGDLAQARLEELERSLAESETNRRRLARLFEASALREKEEPLPPSPAPAPVRERSSARQMAFHALIWAAGLLAGLMLYRFDPRPEELAPRDPAPAAAESAAASEDSTRAEIRELVLDWAASRSQQDDLVVSDVEIDVLSDTRARASFAESPGADSDTALHRLDLVRDAGGWRVERESTLR